MMLAIIGGDPKRFKPYVELYHRTLEQLGKPTLPIGVHSPGHIAHTDAQAKDELWPAFKIMRDRIGAERGWGPIGRPDFDQEADRRLPLLRFARDGRAENRRNREDPWHRTVRPEI